MTMPLFVTDKEMFELLGVTEEFGRPAVKLFDEKKGSTFPKKQPLWNNKRYWPAVVAYFDKANGVGGPKEIIRTEVRYGGRIPKD